MEKGKANKRKAVPWWNNECNIAVKNRNAAFRKVKSSYSFHELIEYKRAQAIVRKTIRSARREYWREFCNTLGRETQISDVWGMIREMGGIRKNSNMPALYNGEEVAITNMGKAEMLAKVFVKVHSNSNLTEGIKKSREMAKKEYPEILEKCNTNESTLDVVFSLYEFKRAINRAKKTSPEEDEICCSMIEHLSDEALMQILHANSIGLF